jgi:hypothetical protein
VLVKPSSGGKTPYFFGGGGADLHPIVAQRMRSVLFSDTMPVYLDNQGEEILSGMRMAAQEAGLSGRDLVPDTNGTWWFTWSGSAIQRTLVGLAKGWGDFDVTEHDIALFFRGATAEAITEFYTKQFQECPTPSEIAAQFGGFAREKYDHYLPEQLLIEEFARCCIDTKNVSPPKIALLPEASIDPPDNRSGSIDADIGLYL